MATRKPSARHRAAKGTGNALYQVVLQVASEAQEPVAALMEQTFGLRPVVWEDARTGKTTVTVYADRDQALGPDWRRRLRTGLADLKAWGIPPGPGRTTVARVRKENWAESWKRHFNVLEISSRLLIKPTWSRRRPKRGQSVVVLDPGLSFGTGHHATTRYCLERLDLWCRGNAGSVVKSVLIDAGCGSGILAIAGAKLGIGNVEAFDNDPEAVRIAQENAKANHLVGRITIRKLDLSSVRSRDRNGVCNILCANLTSDLLRKHRDRLLAWMAPDGWLVLAGILAKEFRGVRRHYESAGVFCIHGLRNGEWECGTFATRNSSEIQGD